MSSSPTSTLDLLPPEDAWATEVAAALRLILASGAEEDPGRRAQQMEEQVRRALHDVPPAQRARHLERLAGHFPTGYSAMEPARSGEAPAAPSAPGTPDDLLRIVTAAWSTFSEAQRDELRDKLAAVGIAAPAEAAPSDGATVDFSEVRGRFGLTAAESVVPGRLARLCVQQMECLAKLDQLAWATWKNLAPRSGLKRDTSQGDLRLLVRRYVKGDADITDLQLAQQIERTRALIASMLGSMAQIGRGYSKRFQTRYAPEAIQDVVKMEGGSGWTGLETKCWRKYIELAVEVNEATIQNEMQEIVAKYVEDLARGSMKGNT